jgi:hypothetical protein
MLDHDYLLEINILYEINSKRYLITSKIYISKLKTISLVTGNTYSSIFSSRGLLFVIKLPFTGYDFNI